MELAPRVRLAPGAMRLQTARSGGPGGQNVNKLNTKVEIWVPLAALTGLNPAALARLRALAGRRLTQGDELHLSAEENRSQEANRAAVFQRLRQLLIEAMRTPKVRRPTRPTAGARRRRLESKRRRSQTKARRQSEEA